MIAPDGWEPLSPESVESWPGNSACRLPLVMALHWVGLLVERGEQDAAFTLEWAALDIYGQQVATTA